MFKKKENNKLPQILNNQENSEAICERIKQEAQEAVNNVLDNAKREVARILEEARNSAGRNKQAVLEEAGKQIQKEKERTLSSMNLEKKRLVLNGRDKFALSVFDKVTGDLGKFRQDIAGYSKFLEKTAVEGVMALNMPELVVNYAAPDEGIFSPDFLKKIESSSRGSIGRDISLKARKSDFNDPGVIISSVDGRLTFDNRLFTRFARIKEEVHMSLLKDTE
jgi:V/A-type H+/Na+-transporting ATPase subunit E